MASLNWINEVRRRGSPLGMHYLCHGLNELVPYLFGIPFRYRHYAYVDSTLRKVKDEDDLLKRLIREAFAGDNSYFLKIAQRIRVDATILESFTERFLNERAVRDTEEKELPRLLESYVALMSHFGAYFRFMEPATRAIEQMLLQLLETHLPAEEAPRALIALSTAPDPDYIKTEHRALLQLAVAADQSLGEQSRESLPEAEYVDRIQQSPELLQGLLSHARTYGWMGTSDHLGSPFSAADYAKRIHDLNLDPGLELATIEQVDQRRRETADRLMEQLKPSDTAVALVDAVREYDFINAFVKQTVLSTEQRSEHLLERIARTLDVDRNTLIMLTFEEILTDLRAGALSPG